MLEDILVERPPDPPAIGARINQIRLERGWSLAELGTRAHVSTSMLSEVERDRANPTLVVAHRIATAFGMTIDELLATPPPTPIRLVSGGDPRNQFVRTDELSVRTLSPLDLDRGLEFYEIRLQPGAQLASAPHAVGTHELLTVRSGRMLVRVGGFEQSLAEGDSAYFRADLDHCIRNVGDTESIAYLIDRYGN
jgi:transcriptional regulator with XRE-family HTH domain